MTACMKRSFSLATAAVVAATLGVAPLAGTPALEERTIFVTVLGANDSGPVLEGLSAANFSVMEDNVARKVTGLAAAADVPITAMLLIDTTRRSTNTVQDLRKGVVAYASQVLQINPQNQVGVIGFGGQANVLQAPTSNIEDITKMSTRIVANTDGSSVLNEAFMEASQVLQKVSTARKMIVTVNHEPADEFSQVPFPEVAKAVQASGATVYSISIVQGQKRDPGRESLLNALTNNSGGLYFGIGTPSGLVGVMQSLGFLAAVQYAVSFERPDGAAPAQQTVVQVNQPGMRALTNQWAG